VGPSSEELKRARDEKDLSEAALDTNDKGAECYKKGDWDCAVRLFKKALEYEPDDENILHNLHRAEERQREARSTIRELTPAPTETMKGVSSGGSGLKGESTTAGDTTSPPLRGFGNVSRGPSLSEADRIYWHTVIPPAACFVAEKLEANAACIIVDVHDIGEALQEADRVHAIERLILKKLILKGIDKVIVISLGGGGTLKGDVELVEAMYEAEQKVFDHVLQVITRDMLQDPVKAAWLTQWAKLDSPAVERLRKRVFAEKLANIRASQDYLQKNPNSPGIRFYCGPACRQVLQAAKGVHALE
jgi:hypothetical protein